MPSVSISSDKSGRIQRIVLVLWQVPEGEVRSIVGTSILKVADGTTVSTRSHVCSEVDYRVGT